MPDFVLLEDGSTFEGVWRGCKEIHPVGEGCFNTSMMGYQEVLTDPSYAGQIVTMTYPEIGNYGVSDCNSESNRVHCAGFIVRELSEIASNFTSHGTLESFLLEHKVPCMTEVDTRAITMVLRKGGAMRCTFMREGDDVSEGLKRIKGYDFEQKDFPAEISQNPSRIMPLNKGGIGRPKVAVLDFGVKRNILKILNEFADIEVFSLLEFTDIDLDKVNFDGYFLSNGPGNPASVAGASDQIQKLLAQNKPVLGICLGHQLLSIALGGRTYKLKFGHRGANHPVKNLQTGKVEITSQNHGYAVDPQSFDNDEVEVLHMNLNDRTVSGIRLKSRPVVCVQYHPESSPGPNDSRYIFDWFKNSMSNTDG
ncbi:MAG: glutamine-hydrolyzing carbamoyl-phosphate synthase small subunit [Planctomycetes bacterium]|nr:glutamine-hydrolyzing carbamoyl-phosphate synthase small subunit [Planctomycetota bacterium]